MSFPSDQILPGDPVIIDATVAGVDPKNEYEIDVTLQNSDKVVRVDKKFIYPVCPGSSREDVDAMTKILINAWEKAEGKLVGASYVATFVDMARAVLESKFYEEERSENKI